MSFGINKRLTHPVQDFDILDLDLECQFEFRLELL